MAEKASLIRIPLRLGDDVFNYNKISEKKQEELIKTMTAYKLLIDVYKPVAYHACATAAMREASNSAEIVDKIYKETGILIEVISGLKEAELVTASDSLVNNTSSVYKMYVDVGGGSTEISILYDHKIIKSKSFKIGTIRYLNEKINNNEWDKMKDWLKEFKKEISNVQLIGSGGNINKIFKLYAHTDKQFLFFHELQHAFAHLSNNSLDERIEKLGLRPDRADVILPACKIFIFIMKSLKAESICVPKIGLADGIIYDLHKKYIKDSEEINQVVSNL